jgi:hypothetical protein
MALKRLKHWATRGYHNFLLERAHSPFVWGANDCSSFAADGVKAITGTDIADDFRGKYHDKESAFALIKSVTGGSTVADAAPYCAKKHGLEELPNPLFAQRGDLVVFVAPTGDLVSGSIHLNGSQIVAMGEDGLWMFPITEVKRAWHVG